MPFFVRHALCYLCLTFLGTAQAGVGENPEVESVFRLSLGPSCMTTAPDGAWILGVNQAERPRFRAVQVRKSGEVTAFPNEKMSADGSTSATPLDAIEGVQADANGVIWILDNGRRSETTPKVLAWNHDKNNIQLVRNLSAPAVLPGSFLADLAVDPDSPLHLHR
jgi:hypothetical protein